MELEGDGGSGFFPFQVKGLSYTEARGLEELGMAYFHTINRYLLGSGCYLMNPSCFGQ